MTEPVPPSNRIWWIVGLGCVLCWVLYLNFGLPRAPKRGLGETADFEWNLVDLNDQPAPFAKFKGKTIFLNVWATWCPPCVREMPSIARLAANPRVKNVAFVCASTDDSGEVVTRFLSGKDWGMTFLRANDLPPVFTTQGIPATFIIAPDGKIVASEIGSKDWDTPETVAMLEGLVKSSP